MKKTLITFEEARDNLVREAHENEQANENNGPIVDVVKDEMREFEILQGRAIKYTTIDGKTNILCPPIKVDQYKIFLKANEQVLTGLNLETLDELFKVLSTIVTNEDGELISKKELESCIEISDVKSIVSLISYGVVAGPMLVKKKAVTDQELERFITTGVAV